ncbi:DHH family phosphoesterase [Clostridium botulinum]|uniref:DHH family phosphoesterase n=1 Tax=Clostridium botulinum TaxID=1491 RepID=UPI00077378D7|nr:DHH family phosphoesterase [Clostridium botulinum]APH20849.1 putative SPBc2 prophage-derived single-strand DNA-specific exonuclease yorK [Clostridium botulinum]MBN3379031.1 hypothetical protein [Clostridium botulinum]
MKFKSLNDGYDFINENNLLDVLLSNRGIKNPQKLLNLTSDVIHDGMLFENMNKGLKLFDEYIERSKNELIKIRFIVDSDVDGYTSSALGIQYINDLKKKYNLNINIDYILHSEKQHGIILKEFNNFDINLLIIPDAGSNDVAECKELKDKGIDILILDHHDIEENNPYAVVLNNQDGEYPNNTLSGVGVTYKFFKEYDKKYNNDFADKYLDLVALGNIADQMDLRNYETRYLTLSGVKQFDKYNVFLKELVEKQSFSLKNNITIMGIGWYIAPLLNAIVRSGKENEKIDVFRALIGEQEYREYKTRKSKKNPNPQIEKESLQKYMARVCTTVKGRQDREVKKGVEKLNDKIKEKQLDQNKILIVDGTNILEKSYTGLVANKLASTYKRPVLLLRKIKKGVYGGSGRNYRLSPIIDLKKFLSEFNTFDKLKGHDNAFGQEIKLNKLIETNKKINESLQNMSIEDVYKVDYEIPIGRLKEKHISQVGEWNDIWGNTLDEPLFAITDIYLTTDEIRLLGSKKNIIKFEKKIGSNKITFIKFFASEKIYNRMTLKQEHGLNKDGEKKLKMDIIGKFKINEWEENKYPQIEIIDFNSIEDKEFLF